VIAAYARMLQAARPPARVSSPRWSIRSALPASCRASPKAFTSPERPASTFEAVIETIAKGAAQSWQMENRLQDHERQQIRFRLRGRLDAQDLSICLAEARRSGAHLPVAALVDQFYSEVQKMGGARWDTSSLMARLER